MTLPPPSSAGVMKKPSEKTWRNETKRLAPRLLRQAACADRSTSGSTTNGSNGKPVREALIAFSELFFSHALNYLDRTTWRHVVATSITEGGTEFGLGYAVLDNRIMSLVAMFLSGPERSGKIELASDATIPASIINNVVNSHFVRFVFAVDGNESKTLEAIRKEIEFVVQAF